MSNKRITDLPAASLPLNDTDIMEVVQGGVNKKAPAISVADATLNEAIDGLRDELTEDIAVVQNDVNTHEGLTNNPHSVTKAQVGLSDVDNTSDADKPVSTAQAAADAAVAAAKQDTLVSGTNIKTINSTSLLGAGDIDLTSFVQGIVNAIIEGGLIYFSDAFTGTGTAEDPIDTVGGTPFSFVKETPAGLINGSNVTYTTSVTPIAGSEDLYKNGQLMEIGIDYNISGQNITMIFPPQTDDRLTIKFRV